MAQPLVSIITLTYNHERFIAECIRSVLAQSYDAWEMIVVDDGSTDGTEMVVRAFGDPRIRYVRQEHVGISGIARSYNQALTLSRGPLVAILEGDDFWPANKLDTLVPRFEDPRIVLAYGITQHVRSDGTRIGETTPRMQGRHRPSPAQLTNDPVGSAVRPMLNPRIGVFTYPCATMLRRAAVERIGGFQTVGDHHAVDTATFITLALHGPFAFAPEVMGFWRRHADSISSSFHVERVLVEDYRFLKTFAAANQDRLGLSARDLQRIDRSWNWLRSHLRCLQGRHLLIQHRWGEARERFLASLDFPGGMKNRLTCVLGILASVAHTDLEFLWSVRGVPDLRMLHRADSAAHVSPQRQRGI